MKLGLIGYGKMGRQIHALALERGHEIRTIDPQVQEADFKTISLESLEGVQVCIDFTHPTQAISNLKTVAALQRSMVMGTTGWLEHLEEAKRIVSASNIGFIYASNFSLGVNLFFRIAEQAAKVVNPFPEYDVSGVELHHRQKADSPSGTAKSLADLLIKNLDRKHTAIFALNNRPVHAQELHFAAVRCGHIPGTHEIIFDSAADSISLKHTARNRLGFAAGALRAAEWIADKKGFFTIDHLLEEMIGKI